MRTAIAIYRKEMNGNFRLFIIPVVFMASGIVLHYLYLDLYYSTKQIPVLLDTLRMMTSRCEYISDACAAFVFTFAGIEKRHDLSASYAPHRKIQIIVI